MKKLHAHTIYFFKQIESSCVWLALNTAVGMAAEADFPSKARCFPIGRIAGILFLQTNNRTYEVDCQFKVLG